MAAANVLTTGTANGSSSDQAITSDTVFGLKEFTPYAKVRIELKDDGGAYNVVGYLTPGEQAKVCSPGTWRFTRVGGAACGVYSA